MDPRELEYVARGISRRGLLVGGAGAAAILALYPAGAAQAAVTWNHPFTTRGAINVGGGYLSTTSPWYTSTTPHQGIDFNNVLHPGGTPIYSCAAGVVVERRTSDSVYGNMVRIQHADGYETLYGHMRASSIPLSLSVGGLLPAASQVGNVGGTHGSGTDYAEHLHLGLFKSGVRQDPTFLVNKPLAQPGATQAAVSGDPMTDIIYFASSGASATTQGLKSPITTVAYHSMWYQECVGAPLFKIADTWNQIEYAAFYGARLGVAGAYRHEASTAAIAGLIDLRGEASEPKGALAPLRL